MSEQTPKTTKKTNRAKWDNVQKLGFWGLIIVSIAFWGGVYLGGAAVTQGIADKEAAKTQAVEEYKASQVAPVK